MLIETHRALLRYKISDFFSSLLDDSAPSEMTQCCCSEFKALVGKPEMKGLNVMILIDKRGARFFLLYQERLQRSDCQVWNSNKVLSLLR
jgi:hypothetical protein